MPTSTDEVTSLGIQEIVARVQAGSLTAEDVTRAYLKNAAAHEATVDAWEFLDPDRAIAEARERDSAPKTGPFAGVPIGVKDVIDTVDMPTGYGSGLYKGGRTAWDAPCVALARAAGAVVLGKTVSTEFAMMSPGKTRNPWNTAHTPGGSSSGSCAAVATSMVPMAFGTQTSGSIIRPAAYCGVIGYKPSFSMLDRNGIKALAGSLDTLGVVTRTVRDAAYCVSVLAQRPTLIVADDRPPPRVGLFRTSRWDLTEPGTNIALSRGVEALEASGVSVRDVPVPAWFDELFPLQDAVMGWEVTQALSYERLNRAAELTQTTRDFLAEKARISLDQYDAACRRLPELRARLEDLFGGLDAVLTPAAPGEAPAGLKATGDPMFNRPWTMLHVPCITIPAGLGTAGLPVGVQLVSRIGDDAGLLAAAAYTEEALSRHGHRCDLASKRA